MSYYFTNDKNVKSEIKEKKVIIQNLPFIFYTDNGVFSKRGLDFGTRTLLESLPDLKGDVLDLGCGYGPIGIYIAATFPTQVDMVDINTRALSLARKNAKANHTNPCIWESDGYQNITKQYDYVITNPPIRVGKKILYDLLTKTREYLKPNGQLWFVIHKDQGAKSVASYLEKFYTVRIQNKNKGFYVIQARKDSHV